MALYIHCDRPTCESQGLNGTDQVTGWIVVQSPYPAEEDPWGGIFCSPSCAIEYIQAHQPNEEILYGNPDGPPVKP